MLKLLIFTMLCLSLTACANVEVKPKGEVGISGSING